MGKPAWVQRMRERQKERGEAKAKQAQAATAYFGFRAYMARVSGETPFFATRELPIKRDLVLVAPEHHAKSTKVSSL